MTNISYGIKDNRGSGDCFFYVIRDAYKSINKDANVKLLRDKLADKVTEEVFNNYTERYTMLENELKTLKNKGKLDKEKETATAYNALVKKIKSEKDFKTRSTYKQEAKILKTGHQNKRKY